MAPDAAGQQIARLGLGTSKLGLGAERGPNGARAGRADAAAAFALADQAGVRLISAGDGSSVADEVLTHAMAPKAAGFQVMLRTGAEAGEGEAVEAALRQILARSGAPQLHALVVSRAESLLGPHGDALWTRLRRLRDEGLCQRLGVAVDIEDQPAALARRFRPDFVQTPISLIDQRLMQLGELDALAELGVGVHGRAVFMQGLWLQPVNRLGLLDAALGRHLSRARRMVAEAGADPMQAALAFVLQRAPLEAALAGVGSSAELKVLLAAAAAPAPDLDWAALAYPAAARSKPRRSAA